MFEQFQQVPTEESIIEYLKLKGQPVYRRDWTEWKYIKTALKSQSRTLYISDLHFSHPNIIKYENRPYKFVEDMNEDVIRIWNEYVNPKDNVYILGDFSFSKKPQEANEQLESLVGHKHLIIGNHDQNYLNKQGFNKELYSSIQSYLTVKDNGEYVCLFHYPIQTWDRQHYGSKHLYRTCAYK